MTIEFGPKLGFAVHADLNEDWYDELTRLLRGMDALIPLPTVIDHELASAPEFPSDGDCYIVGPSATDDWSGYENYLARWSGKEGAWEFYTPRQGWIAYSNALGNHLTYKASGSWVPFPIPVAEEIPLGPTFARAYIDAVLSNENKTTSITSASGTGSSTIGFPRDSGKAYFEFSAINIDAGSGSVAIGIVGESLLPGLEAGDGTVWGGYWFPGGSKAVAHWQENGAFYDGGYFHSNISTFDNADRFGFAVDFDLSMAWPMLNGVAVFGDPEAGTGGYDLTSYVLASGNTTIRPWVGLNGDDHSVTIHAEAADLMHSPPTGFTAWYEP